MPSARSFGPVETAPRPRSSGRSLAVPDWFRSTDRLREDVARLEAENAELRRTVETTDLDRNRLAEFDGLTTDRAQHSATRWCPPT